MKERQILFSAPMIRAILDGSKTQTRRVVKAKHLPFLENLLTNFVDGKWNERPFPYGQPGDRLWVREKWGYIDPDGTGENYANDQGGQGPVTFAAELCQEGHPVRDYWLRRIAYAATFQEPRFGNGPDKPKRWRPSIHMPRWACRIELEITGVRVERLQDISEADAAAEGIAPNWIGSDLTGWNPEEHGYLPHDCDDEGEVPGVDIYDDCWTANRCFKRLWESINGAGSWDANPWVWVIEFRRIKP